MKPFPKNHELLEFFCCEPELSDPELSSWWANCLTFRTTIDENEICVTMEPHYEEFDFEWKREERTVAKFSLKSVVSLELKQWCESLKMIANFLEDSGVNSFELRLRPHIQIRWGNSALTY